jgi:hypothetical protein
MIFTLFTVANRCQKLTLFPAIGQTWRQQKRDTEQENANLTSAQAPIFIIAGITLWFLYVR